MKFSNKGTCWSELCWDSVVVCLRSLVIAWGRDKISDGRIVTDRPYPEDAIASTAKRK